MGILGKVIFPHILRPVVFLKVRTVVILVLHPEIARKVPVVVRTRVRCIIPVEGGVAVLSGTPEDGQRSLEAVCRSAGIFEHGHRLECLAHTCVAELAGLITPVAVVHVVAHEVIDFLGRCNLRATLSRSRESDETNAMVVPELLLHACIVCEIAVVNTFDPVVSTHARRHVESIRPSVVKLT